MFRVLGIGVADKVSTSTFFFICLIFSLWATPKLLLLVDDQKAQVLELHVFRKQPVGSDDQIDLPFVQFVDDLLLLFIGTESGQHFHLQRELFKSFLQSVVVLIGQNRRRNQNCRLLSLGDTFEEGSCRNFGLTEALHHRRAAGP